MISENDVQDLEKAVRSWIQGADSRDEMHRRFNRIMKMIRRCGRCDDCLEEEKLRRAAALAAATGTGDRMDIALKLKQDLEGLECEWARLQY